MKKADIAKYRDDGTLVAVANYVSRDHLPFAVPARIVATEQARRVYSGRRGYGHTEFDGVLVELHDRRTLEPVTVEQPIGEADGLTAQAPKQEVVGPRNIISTWSEHCAADARQAQARKDTERRYQENRARKEALVARTVAAIGQEHKHSVYAHAGSISVSERALEALLEKLPAAVSA